MNYHHSFLAFRGARPYGTKVNNWLNSDCVWVPKISMHDRYLFAPKIMHGSDQQPAVPEKSV